MSLTEHSGQTTATRKLKTVTIWSGALLLLVAASLVVYWGWEFRGPLGFIVAVLFAFGFLVATYLTFLVVLFSVFLLLRPIGELRFRRRMQAKRRFAHWPCLAKEYEGRGGTIIVDNPTLGWRLTQAWWTGEAVLAEAPCPKWVSKDDVLNRTEPHPFEKWCFDNYTSPETGRAILFGVWNGARRARRLAQHLGPAIQIVETWSGSLQLPLVDSEKGKQSGALFGESPSETP